MKKPPAMRAPYGGHRGRRQRIAAEMRERLIVIN
jgi:hypothetical protein